MANMQSPPIEQCERIISDLLQSLEDQYQALLAIEVNPGEYPTNATLPFANKIDDVKNLLADIRTQMAAV